MKGRQHEIQPRQIRFRHVQGPVGPDDIRLNSAQDPDSRNPGWNEAHGTEVVQVGTARQGRAVIGEGKGLQALAARFTGHLVDGGIGMARGHGVGMHIGDDFHGVMISQQGEKSTRCARFQLAKPRNYTY